MPVFTKRLSSLNKPELLSAFTSLGLTLPADQSRVNLHQRLKEHLALHPELMGDPDHAGLFTQAQRKVFEDSGGPAFSAPPSSTARSTVGPPDAPRASSVELQRQAHLRLLQSLNPDDLELLVDRMYARRSLSLLLRISLRLP
ncbi:hypothetical protein C8F01DRAFT_1369546 [Mycena amicta]|nr:hypothetical protein C8F01DRAFT_1369546 [Mycena amicta]